MDHDRLRAVAEFADRHGLFVLSDEIYDRLVYGIDHTCFSSLPGMKDRTVLARRLLEELRDDRMAYRLRLRAGRGHRGPAQDPPVHHHVSAHRGPIRRVGGAHGSCWRGGRRQDARRIRRAQADDRRWT